MIPIPADLKISAEVRGNTCFCCSAFSPISTNDELVPNIKKTYQNKQKQTYEAYTIATEESKRKVPAEIAEKISLLNLREKFLKLDSGIATEIAKDYLAGKSVEEILRTESCKDLSPSQRKALSKSLSTAYLSIDDYTQMRKETARQQINQILTTLSSNPSQEDLSPQNIDKNKTILEESQLNAEAHLIENRSRSSTISLSEIAPTLVNRPQVLSETTPGTWKIEDFTPSKLTFFLQATINADLKQIQDITQNVQKIALREADGKPIDRSKLAKLVVLEIQKRQLPILPCVNFEEALQRSIKEKEKNE